MKLDEKHLYINTAKLSQYLLNIEHIDGRSKAKLLIGFGFHMTDIGLLHDFIIQHAINNDVSMVIQTNFGDKYIIEGNIKAPIDKALKIRSVWIKENKQEIIKFVTLYPL